MAAGMHALGGREGVELADMAQQIGDQFKAANPDYEFSPTHGGIGDGAIGQILQTVGLAQFVGDEGRGEVLAVVLPQLALEVNQMITDIGRAATIDQFDIPGNFLQGSEFQSFDLA